MLNWLVHRTLGLALLFFLLYQNLHILFGEATTYEDCLSTEGVQWAYVELNELRKDVLANSDNVSLPGGCVRFTTASGKWQPKKGWLLVGADTGTVIDLEWNVALIEPQPGWAPAFYNLTLVNAVMLSLDPGYPAYVDKPVDFDSLLKLDNVTSYTSCSVFNKYRGELTFGSDVQDNGDSIYFKNYYQQRYSIRNSLLYCIDVAADFVKVKTALSSGASLLRTLDILTEMNQVDIRFRAQLNLTDDVSLTKGVQWPMNSALPSISTSVGFYGTQDPTHTRNNILDLGFLPHVLTVGSPPVHLSLKDLVIVNLYMGPWDNSQWTAPILYLSFQFQGFKSNRVFRRLRVLNCTLVLSAYELTHLLYWSWILSSPSPSIQKVAPWVGRFNVSIKPEFSEDSSTLFFRSLRGFGLDFQNVTLTTNYPDDTDIWRLDLDSQPRANAPAILNNLPISTVSSEADLFTAMQLTQEDQKRLIAIQDEAPPYELFPRYVSLRSDLIPAPASPHGTLANFEPTSTTEANAFAWPENGTVVRNGVILGTQLSQKELCHLHLQLVPLLVSLGTDVSEPFVMQRVRIDLGPLRQSVSPMGEPQRGVPPSGRWLLRSLLGHDAGRLRNLAPSTQLTHRVAGRETAGSKQAAMTAALGRRVLRFVASLGVGGQSVQAKAFEEAPVVSAQAAEGARSRAPGNMGAPTDAWAARREYEMESVARVAAKVHQHQGLARRLKQREVVTSAPEQAQVPPAMFMYMFRFNRNLNHPMLHMDHCEMVLSQQDFDFVYGLAKLESLWRVEGGVAASYFDEFKVEQYGKQWVLLKSFTGDGVAGYMLNVSRGPCLYGETPAGRCVSPSQPSFEQQQNPGQNDVGALIAMAVAIPVGSAIIIAGTLIAWVLVYHRRKPAYLLASLEHPEFVRGKEGQICSGTDRALGIGYLEKGSSELLQHNKGYVKDNRFSSHGALKNFCQDCGRHAFRSAPVDMQQPSTKSASLCLQNNTSVGQPMPSMSLSLGTAASSMEPESPVVGASTAGAVASVGAESLEAAAAEAQHHAARTTETFDGPKAGTSLATSKQGASQSSVSPASSPPNLSLARPSSRNVLSQVVSGLHSWTFKSRPPTSESTAEQQLQQPQGHAQGHPSKEGGLHQCQTEGSNLDLVGSERKEKDPEGGQNSRGRMSSQEFHTGLALIPEPMLQIQQLVSAMKQSQQDEGGQMVILYPIGRGGFGTVYKGLWRNLEVAVKMVLFQAKDCNRPSVPNSHANPVFDRQQDQGQGQGQAQLPAGGMEAGNTDGNEALHQQLDVMECQGQQRAVLEAAVTSSIAHPNVVATYHYDITAVKSGKGQGLRGMCISNAMQLDWKLYLVQEFCDRGSLGVAIDRRQFHSPNNIPYLDSVLNVLMDVARGMSHIHTKNVIHGDLTPGNILLKHDVSRPSMLIAKISDFGLCATLSPGKSHVSNIRNGTPYYIAPEVVHTGRLSKAADVYSMGVLMWEMFTGRVPWSRTENGALTSAADFKKFPPGTPPSYVRLALQCMHNNPKQRPSFEDCLASLDKLYNKLLNRASKKLQQQQQSAQPPPVPHQQLPTPPTPSEPALPAPLPDLALAQGVHAPLPPMQEQLEHEPSPPVHEQLEHEPSPPVHEQLEHEPSPPVHEQLEHEPSPPVHEQLEHEPSPPVHEQLEREPSPPVHEQLEHEPSPPVHEPPGHEPLPLGHGFRGIGHCFMSR